MLGLTGRLAFWANLVMFSSICPSTLLAFWKIIFIDFFGVTVYN
jgi:hypothetical protein